MDTRDAEFYSLLTTGAIVRFADGAAGVVLANAIACHTLRSDVPICIFNIRDELSHELIRPLFGPSAPTAAYRITHIYKYSEPTFALRDLDRIFNGLRVDVNANNLVYDEERDYCVKITMKDLEEKYGCKVRIVEEETNEKA